MSSRKRTSPTPASVTQQVNMSSSSSTSSSINNDNKHQQQDQYQSPGGASSKSVGKRASYGALLAASREHNAILGTSPQNSPISPQHQQQQQQQEGQFSTSLPRPIVGAVRAQSSNESDSRPESLSREGSGSRHQRQRSAASSYLARSMSPSRRAILGPGMVRPDSPAAVPDGVMTETDVARIVSEHLVTAGEIGSSSGAAGGGSQNYYHQRNGSQVSNNHLVAGVASSSQNPEQAISPNSLSSVSHNLLGGSVTHEIYQWTEKRTTPQEHKRRNSEPDLLNAAHRRTPELVRASDLREPGMFRRHFLTNKARAQGRPEPSLLTRNFIDFLALYGFYGGDVVPEDEAENRPGMTIEDDIYGVGYDAENAAGGGDQGGDGGGGPSGAGEGATEATPLVGGRARAPSTTPVHGTSAKKAFFMLMKAFVGTGVLFLPKAFSNGGMGFSIILLVIIGWLTLHCMLLLVETSRALGGSFGDIGEKLYGPGVRSLVLASIAISQAGFCCAYYIFIAQNLRDLVMLVTDCRIIWPDWVFLILQLLLYVPLSWVRRIKHFSITSLIADVFILMGLAYIFYYDLTVLATRGASHDIVWFNLESFSLFVGTAMFAFEGICLILPIAESMKRPEQFHGTLTLCIVVVGTLFIAIGATGYLTFGERVETVVFLNLPKDSKVVLTLQFFYAVAIMLSFPLTVYPSIRISEAAVFGVLDGKRSNLVKWQKNLMRALLVSFLAYVAWAGSNNLDKVVSLVGCLACIPLSFIYPALFHYHVAQSAWVKAKDIALVVVGTIALVYTTYVTIEQWVDGSPDQPIDRCSSAPGNGRPNGSSFIVGL
ncbi:neutral amino acid transporter [Blyttiomyces sp. JEL0837]|nr:neutral amino acid transporter [Blyttiomyces sp. JEL0837]